MKYSRKRTQAVDDGGDEDNIRTVVELLIELAELQMAI